MVKLYEIFFSTPRAYVHPQLGSARGRVRGSTTDLQHVTDDNLNTWARRKQYDSNMRKIRTAEVVRRSQSFQNAPKYSLDRGERPGSYHSKTRRALPQVCNAVF